MVAIHCNNHKIFNLIVKQAKADVNIKDANMKTALEMALLEKRNLEMAEELVKSKKADLNVLCSKGRKVLGVCLNINTSWVVAEQTLFHKAISTENFAAIQFLAKHGADVNKTNANVRFSHSLLIVRYNGLSPCHLLFIVGKKYFLNEKQK